nr:hypothetical protein [Tanacetum cinerariifolium]
MSGLGWSCGSIRPKRGVKEKNQVLVNDASKIVRVSSGVEEHVLSSLGGHTVEKVIENNDGIVTIFPTNPSSFSWIFSRPTSDTKLVTGEPSKESVNFLTLIALARNRVDVAILLEYVGDISACFANIVYGMPSYVRAMIKLRVDVKFKDTIVVAMPRLVGEGFYVCTIRVEYEWKPLRCLRWKVFGHVLDECPTKIVLDVVKNLNNPKQAARGVQVGPKLGKQVSNPSLVSIVPI